MVATLFFSQVRNLVTLPARLLSKVDINRCIISLQRNHDMSLYFLSFKVGVEGLVVSSGELANVSDKAFFGLEVRFVFSPLPGPEIF